MGGLVYSLGKIGGALDKITPGHPLRESMEFAAKGAKWTGKTLGWGALERAAERDIQNPYEGAARAALVAGAIVGGPYLASYFGGGAAGAGGAGGAELAGWDAAMADYAASTAGASSAGLDSAAISTAASESGSGSIFGGEYAGLGGLDAAMMDYAGGQAGGWGGYGFGTGAGTAGAGSSYYDAMQEWLKRKWAGTSGKQMWRMGTGLYNLYMNQRAARMARPPTAQDVTNSPGYAAMMESVMRQARAGGYQGSPMMASVVAGKTGQLYDQLYGQRQQDAANYQNLGYSNLSALGLLASGFGG